MATGLGQPPYQEEAIESGRESLSDQVELPWYDQEADDIRRIDVPVSDQPYESDVDPGHRSSDWQKSQAKPAKANTAPTNAPTGPGTAPPTGMGAMFEVMLWGILFLFILGIVCLLAWAFLRMDTQDSLAAERSAVAESSYDVDRVEELPFAMNRPTDDLLGSARSAYESGNYSEAITFLFSYQLLQLDRNQMIRLARGKTNRQYLRELRPRPRLADLLEGSMVLFEDAFFGRRTVAKQQFEECWNGLSQFQQMLQEAVV